MTLQSGARAKSNGAALALLREVAQTGMDLAAIRQQIKTLRKKAKRVGVFRECYRSSETVGADAIEIVFLPEINRAGVAAGSDAQWTDARSAADALRRFLNDDMSP